MLKSKRLREGFYLARFLFITLKLKGTYFVGDGVWVHNACKGPALKDAKKMKSKDIDKFLGKDWHKNGEKRKLLKQFRKELKGSTNADFYINKKTKEIFIKGNKSSELIKVGDLL